MQKTNPTVSHPRQLSDHGTASTKGGGSTVPQSGGQTGLPAIGYVRLPTVAAVCGIGKPTIWEWCRKGRFPSPIKLSPRVVSLGSG